jgi:diguanylate cyclase
MEPVSTLDPVWLWAAASGLGFALALATAVGWWRQRRRADALASAIRTQPAVAVAASLKAFGLQPRTEFDAVLEREATLARAEGGTLALLLADVDHFAEINDRAGHRAGDTVLEEIARRLHAASGDKRAAMRMGGDEFVFLFAHDRAYDRAQTEQQARDLQAALAAPLVVGGTPVQVTCSIGIALYPLHGSRDRLLSYASIAMRSVKALGGNGWAVFDPKAAADVQRERALVADLGRAVQRRELELFYQPKIDANTLQVTAAEALLRWHHPTHGMISPAVFIPLAERHGLIGELGNWVIEEACRQAGQWRRAGLRMRVAINLSAYQMRQDDVVARLQKALRANDLDPRRFTVEITESLALENTQATQRTFEGLRKAGLHVAIDDFGAGQTSLAYLRQLPVSELKLDMELVREVATSDRARAIAKAVIGLAHELDWHVVAEGVETAAQRDALVELGADELQGFMFARPMSARALGLWALDPEMPQHEGFRPSLYHTTVDA